MEVKVKVSRRLAIESVTPFTPIVFLGGLCSIIQGTVPSAMD